MDDPPLSPAQFQRDLNLNVYFNLISFVLLFYEYLITFEMEVNRIWASNHRRRPWGVSMFYVNRYGSLLGHLPVVVQFLWTSPASEYKRDMCKTLQTYHQYYTVVVQVMVATVLITRTYALYERNKKVLAVVILVTIAAIIHGGAVTWSVKSDPIGELDYPIPYVGCVSVVGAKLGQSQARGWIGLLVFDTMIFSLTLYKTMKMGRLAGDLLKLIIRDGAFYYLIVLICTLANILTFYMGNRLIRGLLTTFTNVMSSILISRVMFNIRDPRLLENSNSTSGSTAQTLTSPPDFAPNPKFRSVGSEGSGTTMFTSFGERSEDIELLEFPTSTSSPLTPQSFRFPTGERDLLVMTKGSSSISSPRTTTLGV